MEREKDSDIVSITAELSCTRVYESCGGLITCWPR